MAMETTIENIYDKEYRRDSFNKSYAGDEIVKSKVIDRNRYSRYLNGLVNDFESEDPKDRAHCKWKAKKRKFTIAYDSVTGNRYLEGPCTFMKKKSRGPVVCFEDFFDKIYGIHVETQNHSGGRKVQYGLYQLYSGIPRSAIELFIRLCTVCNLRAKNNNIATLNPIKYIICFTSFVLL